MEYWTKKKQKKVEKKLRETDTAIEEWSKNKMKKLVSKSDITKTRMGVD